MTALFIILKFWGGLMLLFTLGWLIGQRIKIDKHLKY